MNQNEFVSSHVDIIAEIGINHNGDINIAKKLIDVAKNTGCDAVKFQKRNVDQVYTAAFLDSPRESPWGTTQRDQKEGLEFSEKDYDEIDNYAKAVGIDWFASAWDYESQNFLSKYNLSVNKVASAMATNQEILELVAGERKLTYLSTGMCDLPQIDNAVAVFKSFDCPFVLMHSVAEYPAPESALNLRCILTLKERYECRIGYSGHESSVSPSIIAATLGACAIERHITLDRAMYGSDQSASLEPHGIETLVAQIRKISVVMGDGTKRVTDAEKINENKLRYWL